MVGTNYIVYPELLFFWGKFLLCYRTFFAPNLNSRGISNLRVLSPPGHRRAHDLRSTNQSSSPGLFPWELREESNFLSDGRIRINEEGTSCRGLGTHLVEKSTW